MVQILAAQKVHNWPNPVAQASQDRFGEAWALDLAEKTDHNL